MKLEGRIHLDMTDIKQAIAEYIERSHQLAVKIPPAKVNLYPVDMVGWGVCASVEIGVAIIEVDLPA